MTYLLDTNILILLLTKEYNRLSKDQLEILNDKTNNYLLSQASYYEMAIKEELLNCSFNEWLTISVLQFNSTSALRPARNPHTSTPYYYSYRKARTGFVRASRRA